MARLPQPGADAGEWGSILNEYLAQTLGTDGTLKANSIQASAIQDGAISEAKLDAALQTKVNSSGGGGGSVTSTDITDSTATGRSVLTAADATAARTAIGAGTSNLAIGTTSTTAKAGNYAPTKADVGLANVDNTSDAGKPVSTATQTALNAKANTNDARFTDQRTPVDGSVTATKLSAGPATQDQVLSYDGTQLAWATITPGGAIDDATTSAKGIVQLAGDLSGTAGAPVVNKVKGVTVNATAPTAGQVLTASNGTAASWQDVPVTGTVTSGNITDSTTTGRALITAANGAAARTTIGAGTSNLAIGTTSTTAKAGDYTPTKFDVGLGNADNTSDANKPVSTATQTALGAKLDTSAAPELIRDTIGTALVAGSNVTITPNDAGDTITIAASVTGGSGDSTAVYALGDPNMTRPVTSGPVTWYVLSGVIPVNAYALDPIVTVAISDASPNGPAGTTYDWRVSMIVDSNGQPFTDGTAISAWPAFIGGVSFVSPGGSARPTISTQSGRRVLLFDGVDDYMTAASGLVAQPLSMIFIGQYLGSTTTSSTIVRTLLGTNSATAGYRFSYQQPINTSNLRLYAGANTHNLGSSNDNNRHIFGAVLNGASSYIIRDAVQTSGNPGTEGADGFRLAATASLSYFSNFAVERVIVGNFSAADIETWRSSSTVVNYYGF
ncbi:MAG: hypothetical protein WAQ27_05615 [Candidatus Microsaccharimonas sp.]